MIRFFYSTLAAGPDAAASAPLIAVINWPLLVSVISAATMTYGNLVALRQNNVKRMLAYSSIAHVGYLLMGFVLLSDAGLAAILFYLLVYTLMNLGAFFFVVAVNNHLKSENWPTTPAWATALPWAGVMMVVFLASLTGVPPFAGFVGKLYLFTAVMDRQWFWLVIIAGLNRVISLYYYFKVVKVMWLIAPGRGRRHLAAAPALAAVHGAGRAGDPDAGAGAVLRAVQGVGGPGDCFDDGGDVGSLSFRFLKAGRSRWGRLAFLYLKGAGGKGLAGLGC